MNGISRKNSNFEDFGIIEKIRGMDLLDKSSLFIYYKVGRIKKTTEVDDDMQKL